MACVTSGLLHQEDVWQHQPLQHLLPVGLHIPNDPGRHILHPEVYLALHGGRTHVVPGEGGSRLDGSLSIACTLCYLQPELSRILRRSRPSSWKIIWNTCITSSTSTPSASSSVSSSTSASPSVRSDWTVRTSNVRAGDDRTGLLTPVFVPVVKKVPLRNSWMNEFLRSD